MDNKEKAREELYKMLDTTYNELVKKINQEAKMNDDLKGVYGKCHVSNDKYPGEDESDKFIKELLNFAIVSLKKNKFEHTFCVKPDKNYPLLLKYLLGFTLIRNDGSWGYDYLHMA